MRKTKTGSQLRVRAISGLHVVVLAWDFKAQIPDLGEAPAGQPLPPSLAGLLGFAIVREEFDTHGAVAEQYVLRGIKRFRDKDKGLPAGTPVPLDEHPIQSLLWADYTVAPGTTYSYRVIPMYGTPKNLDVRMPASTRVFITTESEVGPMQPTAFRHDIYFNRGVIGSQAFARTFPDTQPKPDQPTSAPMRWLSRGLYEALRAFIGRAVDERFALRAAFYEFRFKPIADAFRAAVEAGADVKIVYDAASANEQDNVQTLTDANLLHPDIAIPRTVTEGIRHNKFIVLLENDQPVGVWTGSTNISPSGIFGHSNVGHVVWNQGVAAAYLAYWSRLAANRTPTQMRQPNREATPTPTGRPPKKKVIPLFSARDDEQSVATLQWYADRMAEAQRIVCFTVAFNLDQLFLPFISADNDVLRYIVKDTDLDDDENIGRDRDVLFAAGGRLDEGMLTNFLAEPGNPLSSHDYIHTKYMLVDPLGTDPLVVTGSANFSRPSQRANDENMLVIRGDKRVADIYFGEFMRIFEHHYARYLVKKLQAAERSDPSAGYLKSTAEEWVRPHWTAASYKSKRRRYFLGQ